MNWFFLNQKVLKNGVVLCKLINKISPGSVKKIKEKGPNFMLMENVQAFQEAIKKYGVPDMEIFQTADLFESRNIPQVGSSSRFSPSYYPHSDLGY